MQILNRTHEFCGFTGRVLHVDSRDPCREVAEVRGKRFEWREIREDLRVE